MRRPTNLVYGPDETPPWAVTLAAGLQHVVIMSPNLLYPVLIAQAASLSPATTASIVSLMFLALAVGALLQCFRRRGIGSGYLAQPIPTVVYFVPSLLAAKEGGLPLVLGMTLAAGLFEIALARALRPLRPLFPPEVAGVVVLLIGITTGMVGLRELFGSGAVQPPPSAGALWTALATLAVMVALNVWGSSALRMTCVLVGFCAGYAAALATGTMRDGAVGQIAAMPLVALPALDHVGFRFDAALALPFAVAALAATLKVVGNVTTAQRATDAGWQRPDMHTITGGVVADGLGSVVAALFGSYGVNSGTAPVGLASATGVQSRRVAYVVAAIFAVLAFVPKIGVALYLMPAPVAGAALVFASTFIVVNGLQIMSARLLDTRRTFVIGLALVAGLAVDLVPAAIRVLPAGLQSAVGSALVFGSLVALGLNFVFRYGVRKVAALTVAPAAIDTRAIEDFMESRGAAWGARRDTVERASFNLAQALETIVESGVVSGPMQVEASFDEFRLDVRVSYSGRPIELPAERPSDAEIVDAEGGHLRLAGWLLRRFADRVTAVHRAGRTTLTFHFDH